MRYAWMAAAALCAAGLAPAGADEADDGRALYQVYCTQCHGLEGDGRGVNVEHLSVMPRDHTNRAEMAGRSDEELFGVIKNGGRSISQSVLMPAWGGNLSDEQIRALVHYLRVLCCERED